jgi:hypothetical protein
MTRACRRRLFRSSKRLCSAGHSSAESSVECRNRIVPLDISSNVHSRRATRVTPHSSSGHPHSAAQTLAAGSSTCDPSCLQSLQLVEPILVYSKQFSCIAVKLRKHFSFCKGRVGAS